MKKLINKKLILNITKQYLEKIKNENEHIICVKCKNLVGIFELKSYNFHGMCNKCAKKLEKEIENCF
jgi:uncharacterized paraquat-inducible protein A